MERTERELHETFYRPMQVAVMGAEEAIRDARPLIERLLENSAPASGEYFMATTWLDRHGRTEGR